MRIYIAGPYTGKSDDKHQIPKEVQRNVDHAIEIFHKLKDDGHQPYVPHLSHYLHLHPSGMDSGDTWYYEYDLTFIEHWAEAIFMLEGWKGSYGSVLELERAKELNLKVFLEEKERDRKRDRRYD